MRHPLDEKIKNDPDFLNSLPEEYRLMYLLSKQMRFNNTMDAVEQVSKRDKWSEDEKQKVVDEVLNWHCDVCDKSFKQSNKNRHENSKKHKNKIK